MVSFARVHPDHLSSTGPASEGTSTDLTSEGQKAEDKPSTGHSVNANGQKHVWGATKRKMGVGGLAALGRTSKLGRSQTRDHGAPRKQQGTVCHNVSINDPGG